MGIGFRTGVRFSSPPPATLRGGHFPSRFFVNTQSHRCDNLCVTFTNSGACPCTQSALLYVERFFIAAHQFYLKPNHCFAVAGISRQGFFVNTQSHRCDNLCVTFTNSGACPCTRSALLYVRRFFIAAHQFYLKPNHCFAVAGISRQGFFVNSQSHRCDNLCVTFTNSGACPCTQSALLYVGRFFIAAHGSLFINPTLLFHHGRR